MKILILTGKFGMGHCSAAKSIKEMIDTSKHQVEIVDVIKTLSPKLSNMIYGAFNGVVTKNADLYNWFIKTVDKGDGNMPFQKTMAKRMGKLIRSTQADCVVSTLHFGAQYASAYKEYSGDKIPLFTVITDISSKNEWIAKNTTKYFVATEGVRRGLIKKGIESSKIVVTGIPVGKSFGPREIQKTSSQKQVLIMGGGLGLMPLPEGQIEELNNEKSIKTTIITGRNKELYYRLKNKFTNINVVGFTSKVSEYMKNADLLVTKAGGICMFEAIRSEIPMVVINPFLAQEVANGEYIESKNIGEICRGNHVDYAKEIIKLLHNVSKLDIMKRNMQKLKAIVNQERIVYEISNFDNYDFSYNRSTTNSLLQNWMYNQKTKAEQGNILNLR